MRLVLRSGLVVQVDAVDVGLALAHDWRPNKKGYLRVGVGKRTVYLHRLIAGTPPGVETDHRNGDPLDNRRANLRVATNSQNQANRKPRDGRHKGVTPWRKKWRAQITVDRRHVNLGSFDTPDEAAAAYDDAALAAWGEFARPNFPTEGGADGHRQGDGEAVRRVRRPARRSGTARVRA